MRRRDDRRRLIQTGEMHRCCVGCDDRRRGWGRVASGRPRQRHDRSRHRALDEGRRVPADHRISVAAQRRGAVRPIVLSISFGGPKFEPSLEKFLYLVAYFVTPWLAIVIIDFWVLNRGGKDCPPVGEFYKRDGVLGGIRWAGLLAFLIGVGVSVPFMATVLYTGPDREVLRRCRHQLRRQRGRGERDLLRDETVCWFTCPGGVEPCDTSAGDQRDLAIETSLLPGHQVPGRRNHPCAGVPTVSSITDVVSAASASRTAWPTSAGESMRTPVTPKPFAIESRSTSG